MANTVQHLVPADVLTIRHNDAGQPADPPQTHPLFTIDYRILPYVSAYSDEFVLYSREADADRSSGAPTVYVGLVYVFDIRMTLPDRSASTSLSVSVTPPHSFSVRTVGHSRFAAPSDSSVYGAMVTAAFGRLSQELANALFLPGSPSHQRLAEGLP